MHVSPGLPTWLPLVMLALGAVLAAPMIWYGIQSLRQAQLLGRAQGGAAPRADREAFAARGEVLVDSTATAPRLGACLWYKHEELELRRIGKNRRWIVVSTEERAGSYRLRLGWGELRVSPSPTEIHGRRTEEWPVPGYETWLGGSTRKTRVQVLPVVRSLTVLGRLRRDGDLWRLEKHPLLGLLVATDELGSRAWKERLKGIACLLLAGSGLWLGVWAIGNLLRR